MLLKEKNTEVTENETEIQASTFSAGRGKCCLHVLAGGHSIPRPIVIDNDNRH